ncbi:MAG: hypothetical protein AAF518_06260 [Spirochaetota bacterium]
MEENHIKVNVDNTGSMAGVNIGTGKQSIAGNIKNTHKPLGGAEKAELEKILQELQTAINAEKELSESEKQDALGFLGKITENAFKPIPETSMIHMAVQALHGLLRNLPAAADLVLLYQASYPKILQYFGL